MYLQDAYRALTELKVSGVVTSVGIGVKDHRIVDFIVDHVQLDWVMLACCLTVFTHDSAVQILLRKLKAKGIHIINAGVFNSGFLVGEDSFNYQKIDPISHPDLFDWRVRFNEILNSEGVLADDICTNFSFRFPEISSVALNANSRALVKRDVDIVYNFSPPESVWTRLQDEKLVHMVNTLPIVQTGDPVLLQVAAPFDLDKILEPDTQAFIQRMIATMYSAPGVGLAAPQVGISLRILVFYLPATRDDVLGIGVPLTVLINPVLEIIDSDPIIDWEGCLSVAGMRGKVSRAKKIRYYGLNDKGERVDRVAEGWHARLVQHENDHLNGILYPALMDAEDQLIDVSVWRAQFANK